MNIAPIKIIVVNNEQEVLSHISVGLLNEGCIVYQATTRKECLESIEKYSPHIVILDDEFGDGKGKDICREIKSNPKTESIFVILCAATKRTAGIIFSQLNGMADDYITKEAETWEIRSSIRSFIKIQEATNKITEQQQYYTSLFAYHPDAVYSFDLQGNFTSVNNAGTTLTGYSKEELLSMSFMPLIAPDYLSTCMEFFVKVLKGETHYYNAAIIHKDGHRVEINITGIPIIVNGEIIGIHGISKNITTSVRLKKITVSENKVLELALTGSTLEECLTFLIKSIEDISEGIMGSIMLVEEDGKTLRSGPSPSLPKAYTDCIDGKEIGPEAGSCGTSVYLKKSVFVSDIAQDKLWLNYKDVTLTHGLKACFSFPIFSSTGEVLGTFGYYYTHVHLPDKNDTQLMERAVNIAGILIERDKSQKQIYRKDEQLQEISTFLPGALYQFQMKKDGSFSFPYFSPTIKQLYNISLQEIYAHPQRLLKAIHPEDMNAFYTSIQVSAQTMQPWLLDYRVTKPDGQGYMWVRGHSIPKEGDDGTIIWHGLLTDITDIKKTEETLRMLSRAVESAAEGILITDNSLEDNPIIYANEKFYKDTGYNREEIIGHNCRFLQGKDTDRSTVDKMRAAIRSEQLFIDEIYNYKKDGTPFWNLLVVAPVLDNEGKVTHFVGLVNDISERKEAEEKLLAQNKQLRKINQELDRFVYSVSHDLRAPLTSVMGLINLTLESSTDNRIKEYLQLMEKSIGKLDKTIKDILDYSRNTRTDILIEKIELHSLVDEVFNWLQFIEGTNLLTKHIQIDEAIPCYSDRSRLSLILNNIISNAKIYRNPLLADPFIHIQIVVTHDNVTFTIKDNGIGVPEKHIDKIFNMFFRASKQSTGTGLGLYIVKETVAKLNGSIQVSSKVNEGTEFVIIVPNHLPAS